VFYIYPPDLNQFRRFQRFGGVALGHDPFKHRLKLYPRKVKNSFDVSGLNVLIRRPLAFKGPGYCLIIKGNSVIVVSVISNFVLYVIMHIYTGWIIASDVLALGVFIGYTIYNWTEYKGVGFYTTFDLRERKVEFDGKA
jgi:hypothetical protein